MPTKKNNELTTGGAARIPAVGDAVIFETKHSVYVEAIVTRVSYERYGLIERIEVSWPTWWSQKTKWIYAGSGLHYLCPKSN